MFNSHLHFLEEKTPDAKVFTVTNLLVGEGKLVQDSCLKGIAAVKNPDKKYKEGVFAKAQATVQANKFPLEFNLAACVTNCRMPFSDSGFSTVVS